jgi:hypothetical protein
MAKYIVKELSYINGSLVQPGETVDYDGEASANLEPVKTRRGKVAETAEGNESAEQSVE